MSRFTTTAAALLLAVAFSGAARLNAQQPPESSSASESGGQAKEPRKPRVRPRPRVSSSNTGYIDNALIRTRFRIRYDSAFDADSPDRAEFLYGKCFCLTRQSGQSGAGSPGPVGGGQPGGDFDYQELRLYFEYAVRSRFSLFLEAPYRTLDGAAFKPFATNPAHPSFDPRAIPGTPSVDDLVPFSASGLGDANLGFRYGLVDRPGRAVTFQLRAHLPTGDAKKGLGTDHPSVEPAVLWFQKLSDRWNFESELALWMPTDGSSDPVTPGVLADGMTSTVINPATGRQVPPGESDPVDNSNFAGEILRFGVGLSHQGRTGKRFSITPVAELVGWYVLDGYKSVHFDRTPARPGRGHFQEANGDLIANLKLGIRIAGRGPGSLYAGYGFALTDDIWYDDVVRVEYRIGLSGRKRKRAGEAAAREPVLRREPAREAEARRVAAEAAAREAESRRAAAEAAARDAESRRVAAGAAAREAESRRAEAEAAAAAQEAALAAAGERATLREQSIEAEARAREAFESELASRARVVDLEQTERAREADERRRVAADIERVVRSWAKAWSEQDVERYLSFYGSGFVPAGAISRQDWERQRRTRVSGPTFIEVTIGAIEVTSTDSERFEASFQQDYRSDSYRDQVNKTLTLQWEQDAWRILLEQVRP